MSDDKKAEPASSKEPVVTDASLDSAAEKATEKEVEKPTDLGAETPSLEKTEEKEKPEDIYNGSPNRAKLVDLPVLKTVIPPETAGEKIIAKDNAESTRLGRKFVVLEEQNQALQQRLDAVEKRGQEPVVEEEFIYPTTKAEMKQHFQDFQKEDNAVRAEEQKTYESGYLQKLETMAEGISAEDHKAVLDKMGEQNSPFNKRYSNNSGYDAEKNFLKAQNSVLKGKLDAATTKEPTNPLKGETPTEALGVGGESKVVSRPVKEIKLDKAAQEFKDSMGWDDKKVASAFEGEEMPSMQRGM